MKKSLSKQKLTAATLSIMLMGVSVAHANRLLLADMDADKNGTVSETEFNQARAKRIESRALEGRQMRGLSNAPQFAEVDVNHDGQLTTDEFMAFRGSRQGNQGNANLPMGISQGQGMNQKMSRPVFDDFDANKDNELTEKEFYDARNKRIAERATQGYAMRGLANAPSFADIDSDKDGHVSQQEFNQHQLEHRQFRPRQQSFK